MKINKIPTFLLLLLICFSLILIKCGTVPEESLPENSSNQKTNLTEPVKKEPPPASVKSLIKCIEYYYRMKDIQDNKKPEKTLAFEIREYFKLLINPIFEESQETNIYELNALYPDLGTQFYTKLIVGLEMFRSIIEGVRSDVEAANEVNSKGFWATITYAANEKKIDKEKRQLFIKSEILQNRWDDWLDENIDMINKTLREKYMTKGIIKISKSSDDYVNRGEDYLGKNEYDFAISSLTKAIQAEANNDTAFKKRGDAFFGKKEFDKATADYSKAIQLNPGNADAFFMRGVVSFEKEKYNTAITDLKKAINLNPDLPGPYFFIGVYYHKIGKQQLAFKNLEKAQSYNPGNPELWFYYGLASYDSGKYVSTVTYLRKAAEFYLNNQDELNALSLLSLKWNILKYEPATLNSEESGSTNFNFFELFQDIGNIFLKIKNYPFAELCFLYSIKISPDSSLACYNLACVYSLANQIDKSLENIKRSFQLSPGYIYRSQTDTDLANLRKDPRYNRLLKEINEIESSDHSDF